MKRSYNILQAAKKRCNILARKGPTWCKKKEQTRGWRSAFGAKLRSFQKREDSPTGTPQVRLLPVGFVIVVALTADEGNVCLNFS